MTSPKSRTATTLLAFFLGAFGVHRFYAGKIGSGIAMLILTCTLIGAIVSGVWAFVDFIVAASGSFKDGTGRTISNW
jgi:TM2 domain-containing membrane protein YozV